MDDRRLWENIKKGNKESLKILHDRYFHQMILYTLKSVHETGEVEELVSDCFIKLWENKKKIEIKESVKSYLFFVLRNSIVDNYRAKRIITESLEQEQVTDIADEFYFDEQSRYADLYHTINKLPVQRKKILEMAVFDEMTYQEIADSLEISKNTVKTQIGRAYRFLKENLNSKSFLYFILISRNKI